MMYILSATPRRVNGKRHIVTKSEDIKYLEKIGSSHINAKRYIVEIYDGAWRLVKAVRPREPDMTDCTGDCDECRHKKRVPGDIDRIDREPRYYCDYKEV